MTQTNKTSNKQFWRNHFSSAEAGTNLSWGSVIAGVVTFFAVFLLLTFITTAIGFGTFKPTSNDPLAGVGTGMLIWSALSLLLSLLAAGFLSGLAARKAGMLHGFLTWALSTTLLVVFLTSGIFSAVGAVGQVLSTTLGAVGNAAGAVASTAGGAAEKGLELVGAQFSEIDTKELQTQVQSVLKDTEEPALQPEYIQGMLNDSKNDVLQAAKEFAVNPNNSDAIFQGLMDKLKGRADELGKAADKDAIKKAVAKNTSLTQQEADQAVENIHKGLQNASDEAKKQLDQAEKKLNEFKAQAEKTAKEARETAENVSHTISLASVLLFLAMLVGLVLTSVAGYVGSNKTRDLTVAQQ